ncbi:MAG TPA: hypothetical protein VMS99_07315 [Acidimicrobiia bacterium]|nr:hypothetical protein [Acidimicrobiia bacterium]
MRRTIDIVTLAAALLWCLAAAAGAGMIAIVTFDEVPSSFEAGTTYQLGYSIMAPSQDPIEFGATSLRFHGREGETLVFAGAAVSKGEWTADVILPAAGEWRWEVTVDNHVLQSLGTLSVEPSSPGQASASLLTSLRIGLPVAALLALLLLIGQILPRVRIERPAQVTDVV